jgi:hypothetical protein
MTPEDYVRWQMAQSRALNYASEAYHGAAAVERVVLGQQLGLDVNLRDIDVMNAVNEQVGFVWEQFQHIVHHHDEAEPEEKSAHGEDVERRGMFLWKTAKYVERTTMMLSELSSRPGCGYKLPPRFSDIQKLSMKLVKDVKKSSKSDRDKSQMAYNMAKSVELMDMEQQMLAPSISHSQYVTRKNRRKP